MARTYNRRTNVPPAGGRTFSARIIRRDAVNIDLLTDAFVGLALARIEKEAEQQHKRSKKPAKNGGFDEHNK